MTAWRSVLVGLVLGLAAAAAAGDAQEAVGKPAHEFAAIDSLNLRPTRNPVKSLRGRVILLVNFGTWYERCVEAVPRMNEMHDRFGPLGLTIVAYTEEDRSRLDPFVKEKGAKFGLVTVDTPVADQMKRWYPAPAYPHAFLVDAKGVVAWQGHPQALKDAELKPFLEAASAPPVLPGSLAEAQALLDEGKWAAARASLLVAAGGGKLDKTDTGWAKGTAEWIERRRARTLPDAEELAKVGAWWDAWKLCDDFPRRFEGMEGIPEAQARAAEIRKIPEAQKDLEAGDEVAKARDLIARKKLPQAKLLLERIVKQRKGTRHAERAQELLESL